MSTNKSLTVDQRESIYDEFATGDHSKAEIAREHDVSRQAVAATVDRFEKYGSHENRPRGSAVAAAASSEEAQGKSKSTSPPSSGIHASNSNSNNSKNSDRSNSQPGSALHSGPTPTASSTSATATSNAGASNLTERDIRQLKRQAADTNPAVTNQDLHEEICPDVPLTKFHQTLRENDIGYPA